MIHRKDAEAQRGSQKRKQKTLLIPLSPYSPVPFVSLDCSASPRFCGE